MYNAGKIIPGLVIFLGLMTFPFWSNLGRAAFEAPELVFPETEEECVEPGDWMRANHMILLDDWRDLAVRDNVRLFTSDTGKRFDMSLTKTCLSSQCHANKDTFCDRCHDALAIAPHCWDCHVVPSMGEE